MGGVDWALAQRSGLVAEGITQASRAIIFDVTVGVTNVACLGGNRDVFVVGSGILGFSCHGCQWRKLLKTIDHRGVRATKCHGFRGDFARARFLGSRMRIAWGWIDSWGCGS